MLAIAAAGFVTLLVMVCTGSGIVHADAAINSRTATHLARVGHGTCYRIADDVTGVVSPVIDVAVLLIVAVALAIRRLDPRPAILAIQTVAFTSVVVIGLKFAVGRVSPTGIQHARGAFPSGHTASALVFGTTIVLLVLHGRARVVGVVAAVVIAVVVGGMLVYIRAHWLSDVLASLLLGPLILAAVRRLPSYDAATSPTPVRRRANGRRSPS